MTKEQCEAIIKTIETATIFLYENGICTHEKIITKSGEDTVIAAAVTEFSNAIDAIITDIPDDEP